MLLFNDAYKIVMDSAFIIGTESIDILQSLKRVLAEDVRSDMDMPPFDKSAMDGYACRKNEQKYALELIETIPAGKNPEKQVASMQCSKIMTGAKVPEGSDCVVMVEDSEVLSDGRIRFTKETTVNNICYQGEDVKTNDIVLTKGTLLKPQHIAILSSVGCVKPLVFKQPKVGIIATGNELVEPFQKPNGSQIRNSNGYQMYSQVIQTGAIANYVGIAKDDEAHSIEMINNALLENDIILLSGGVSMGDFDFVGTALEKKGIKILFDSIAVQPGRPTTFGIGNNKICFGMPGNPVSSFIQYELLAKPLILKMMGNNVEPVTLKFPLKKTYTRKKTQRLAIIPVNINADSTVEPTEYHSSAQIFALGYSNSFMFIPLGVNEIKAGELVDVRQL